MSDPSQSKRDRELCQARAFLAAIQMPYQEVFTVKHDPPDVRVSRFALPALDLEISEYHSTTDRVASEARASQLRTLIDQMIQQKPALFGVSLRLLVQDANIPRRNQHRALAEQLVECVEAILTRRWFSAGLNQVVFMPNVAPGYHEVELPDWLELSSSEWPIVAAHILQIDLTRTNFDFCLPVAIYQTQVGWCDPRHDALRVTFGKKEGSDRHGRV